MAGEQTTVEHLGVGEDDVALSRIHAFFGGRVAVMGARNEAGEPDGGERAELVVGEGLD